MNHSHIRLYFILISHLAFSSPYSYAAIEDTTTKLYLIPDLTFRTALKIAYPECFTKSDSLIIDAARRSERTKLNLIGKGISDLEGIKYFEKLEHLYCSYNNLKILPALPPALKYINASKNCFCPAAPEKPVFLPDSGWIISPNKSSCLVHFSTVSDAVPYSENAYDYITQTDLPINLKLGKGLYFDEKDYLNLPSCLSGYNGNYSIEFWCKAEVLPTQLQYEELAGIVGLWNHIAIIYNRDLVMISIYLNGALKITKQADTGSELISSHMVGFGNNRFKGLLNDLRVWKSVRTKDELKSSMFTFTDYKNPALAGAWKMNEGEGTEMKGFAKPYEKISIRTCSWKDENNGLSYSWQSGPELSDIKEGSATFTSRKAGNYTYTVTANNSKGCIGSRQIKIRVNDMLTEGSSPAYPVSAGVFDRQRTEFKDIRNNDPGAGYHNARRNESPDIFYYFWLNEPAHFTINHCGSGVKSTSITVAHVQSDYIRFADNADTSCSDSDQAFFSDYLLPGAYEVICEGKDYECGNITTSISADFSSGNGRKGLAENTYQSSSPLLFPNPASDFTQLTIPDFIEPVELRISDISGRTVHTIQANSPLTYIRTESLNEGIYNLTYTTGNTNHVQKFLVSR